jgi:hypothetical protein
MPGEFRALYISTTLCIVIFTTVVLGGLTEPLLTALRLRGPSQELSREHQEESDHGNYEVIVHSLVMCEINVTRLHSVSEHSRELE